MSGGGAEVGSRTYSCKEGLCDQSAGKLEGLSTYIEIPGNVDTREYVG